MKWLAAAAMLVACDRRPAVTSCDEDLHGSWVSDTGARWSLLDYGSKLEAYPAFDDAVVDGAPRAIDLERADKLAPAGRSESGQLQLRGEVTRRYTRGADTCEARAPVRIATCNANTLQIVVADPPPPLAFAPCSWPRPAASRVEHWRRD